MGDLGSALWRCSPRQVPKRKWNARDRGASLVNQLFCEFIAGNLNPAMFRFLGRGSRLSHEGTGKLYATEWAGHGGR